MHKINVRVCGIMYNSLLICYASGTEKSRRLATLDARVAKLELALLQLTDGPPPISATRAASLPRRNNGCCHAPHPTTTTTTTTSSCTNCGSTILGHLPTTLPLQPLNSITLPLSHRCTILSHHPTALPLQCLNNSDRMSILATPGISFRILPTSVLTTTINQRWLASLRVSASKIRVNSVDRSSKPFEQTAIGDRSTFRQLLTYSTNSVLAIVCKFSFMCHMASIIKCNTVAVKKMVTFWFHSVP